MDLAVTAAHAVTRLQNNLQPDFVEKPLHAQLNYFMRLPPASPGDPIPYDSNKVLQLKSIRS
jgi:hypothetical protein